MIFISHLAMPSQTKFSMFKMNILDIRVSRHRNDDNSDATLTFVSIRTSRYSTSDVFPIRKLQHFRGTVKPQSAIKPQNSQIPHKTRVTNNLTKMPSQLRCPFLEHLRSGSSFSGSSAARALAVSSNTTGNTESTFHDCGLEK